MKKVLSALTAVALLTAGGFASAGTKYENYSLTVPKMNGSVKTSAQTKSNAGKSANLKVTTLGKHVDARAYSAKGGTGKWVRVSTTGTYDLHNEISKNDATRVHVSSDLLTVVASSMKGSWRSN
ncbi:hypothetical protein [Shouchella lonarensis]|uniref:Uncharacterized protein n=1 Tax=Shouchella lonarensis TaxID=1464122 RepID=A0A1G6MX76_9BACI|nr:hypothetical protein [Shouchella lonarensis]SDC60051.1 hypothetical protein SAMN05421737_11126 [Shouchella lonarensis]